MTKSMIIISTLDIQDAVSVIVSVLLFAILSKIMFAVNIRKMEGNYL